MAVKSGPLTLEELLNLWKSMVDSGYSQPLLENPESGIEAIQQAHRQFELASESIDKTTQAMFILPWSGQSDVPSAGRGFSTTLLDVERSKLLAFPILLVPTTIVNHIQRDFGETGGIDIASGRRYLSNIVLVFIPGETGPLQMPVTAELPGYNYNLPLPGTIKVISQPGSGFNNVEATVIPGASSHQLVVTPIPDVVVPLHVGQYIQLTAGANIGSIRRVVGYAQADLGAPNGGTALLDADGIFAITGLVGMFIPGEQVDQATTSAHGVVVFAEPTLMMIARISGDFQTTFVITGVSSGATATISTIDRSPDLVAETSTAAWKVLDWVEDLGFTVTNPEQPTGGNAAFLDELGNERGVNRSPGETDELYRKRVATPADVVSPNALRRAANRVLAPLGVEGCLREVGSNLFRGFFYDAPAPALPDITLSWFYDMDMLDLTVSSLVGMFIEGEQVTQTGASGNAVLETVASAVGTTTFPPSFDGLNNIVGEFTVGSTITGAVSGATATIDTIAGGLDPLQRFHLLLSTIEFRGFFLMGVPPLGGDDFGFGWDEGGVPFFDSAPFETFYDGFSLQQAAIYASVFNALDRVRAGGVGFDLYIEDLGCF